MNAYWGPVPSFVNPAWIQLTGPEGELTRRNPRYIRETADDWGQEFAMQAGMMGGCEAYNAAKGWQS